MKVFVILCILGDETEYKIMRVYDNKLMSVFYSISCIEQYSHVLIFISKLLPCT
jgi:hypothetical protein